jgi:hypothetical protein
MSADGPDKKDGDAFDVVLVHGATGDGQGARVLRARPGHLEAGEVRPLRDGQPIAPGGEVVRLVERSQAANVYDVKVDYAAPPAPGPTPAAAPTPAKMAAGGPPQIASPAYRASWDRTFASKRQQRSKPN